MKMPEVVAIVYSWALSNPEIQKELLEKYSNSL